MRTQRVKARVTFNGCLELFLEESEETLGLLWFNVTRLTAMAEGITDGEVELLVGIAEKHGVELEVTSEPS